MKIGLVCALLTVWNSGWVASSTYSVADETFTLNAIFMGSDEEFRLKFKDEKGNIILFDDVSDELSYELDEDDDVGSRFQVVWKYDSDEEIEEYDDTDESGLFNLSNTKEEDNRLRIIVELVKL